MKILDYLFVSLLTLFLTLSTKTSTGQSVDLLLSSDNNCVGQLEIGIFAKASQFSALDFKIGSTSILLDYDPNVVQFHSYIENEFSVNIGSPNGWLPHQLSYDDDCGLFSLVLELEDPAINSIYLSRQQATKIGVVKFVITDPATDPKIAVRPEFTNVFGAGSNNGSASIPILNIPQVLDYSCVEDCDVAPVISITEIVDENCFEGIGGFEIYIDDNLERDSIEISVNGGFDYEYTAAVGGDFSVGVLSSGYYDLWVRWQNDQCPTPIGNYYLGNEGGPNVAVSIVNNCDINNPASIQFTFPNQMPTINSLKFSIDGGIEFSPIVSDNTGSYTFENLVIGQYDCFASWGDGSCLTNLGTIDVIPADYPTLSVRQYGHCHSDQEIDGAILFDIVDNPIYERLLISIDDGVTFPYLVNDDIGTFGIYNFNKEKFVVRAKWESGQCSYYYGTGYFKYIPRTFNLSVEHSSTSCVNVPDAVIDIGISTNETPKPSLSIDGQNYFLPTDEQNQYLFENLGPGDYPIYLKWGDCIEYHSLVSISDGLNCPNCFDGIKNGDETYIDCGGSFCTPCDECQSLLAISADEIEEDMLFRSSDKIEINGVVNEYLQLDLQAAQEILLKPQFEVSTNTTFSAHIQDCN